MHGINNIFIQRKAGYIKRVAEILLKDYDSDIPSTFDELVSILQYPVIYKYSYPTLNLCH